MKKFLALLAAAAMTLVSVSAFAAYDMKIDDDTFGKVAVAAQFQFLSANPGPDKLGTKVADSAIAFSGQITNQVKFGLSYGFGFTTSNTSTTAPNAGKVKDVLIMFDLAKEFKINTGIYRMAVSRVALQDTYQIILIDNPDVAGASFISANGLAGYRNAGVTVWGDLLDGMLRYNAGVWDGAYAPTVGAFGGPSNEIGYSGRLVLNFMDPEKGYTCGECYLGKAKVANVGAGYYQIENSAGDRTYKVMTADAFYDANNLTLEGAYFQYDYDNAAGQKPTGWFAEAAYLFGKIQPAARYESWDEDVAANDNQDYENIVLGVNYLISGLDARVSLQYKMQDFDGTGTDVDTATAQFQVRF